MWYLLFKSICIPESHFVFTTHTQIPEVILFQKISFKPHVAYKTSDIQIQIRIGMDYFNKYIFKAKTTRPHTTRFQTINKYNLNSPNQI